MVTIARIEGTTRILGKDQKAYQELPVRDGEIKGVPSMTSAWELTLQEIDWIKRGAKIYITVLGDQHPPIRVMVENVGKS